MPNKTDPYPFRRLIESAVDLGELSQGTATYVLDLFEHTAERRASRRRPAEQGRSRFTAKAWDAIAVLEKELASLGCKRLVLQPGKKFATAVAYTDEA